MYTKEHKLITIDRPIMMRGNDRNCNFNQKIFRIQAICTNKLIKPQLIGAKNLIHIKVNN
jgi:hypothetical protein